MEVGVHVALGRQERHGAFASPRGPVVRGEHHVELAPPQVDGLGEVGGPGAGVAHLSPTDGEDVVEGVRRVLGRTQGPVVGEEEVHLRRCLGPGGHLEHDPHPVDDQLLARGGDVDGGRDQGGLAQRGRLPQAGPDLTGRPLGERRPVHVPGPAGHGRAGVHVLGHRVVHEPLGGDHLGAARGHVVVGDDPLHAAEVVDVGVGVDHGHHRPRTTVLGVEGERGGRRLPADQRVDDDHPGVTLDHAHDREVEPTELVDAGHHLEQPVLDQQLALPPQARVRRVGRRAVEEAVGVEVPDHPALRVADLALLAAGHEAVLGVVEVLGVVPRLGGGEGVDRGPGGGADGGGGRGGVGHEALLGIGAGRSGRAPPPPVSATGVGGSSPIVG